MNLLELFSGSGQVSQIFREAGHKTITLDIEKKYHPDICCDILDFDMSMLGDFNPDVIFAAPDCKTNSTASMGHHWTGGNCAYIPRTDAAKKSILMFQKTVDILHNFNGLAWLENPACLTRKLPMMVTLERTHPLHTIWHCKYASGDEVVCAKPTDIWTNSKLWIPRPPCKNKRTGSLNTCQHEAAPRGSKTGTQGLKNSYERAKYPEQLMREILSVCELETTSLFKGNK